MFYPLVFSNLGMSTIHFLKKTPLLESIDVLNIGTCITITILGAWFSS